MTRRLGALSGFALLWLFASSLASAATFVVTKTADTNDGACDADCSLREAVIAANADPDMDEIVLGPGTYALTIPNPAYGDPTAGDLNVTEAVAIRGAGREATILDASAAQSRAIAVDYTASPASGESFISDMTIRGGTAGTFTIGGCVYLSDGRLTISNATIRDCTAGSGGGAAGFSSALPYGLSLIDVTLADNTATQGGGGALYVLGSSASARGCTFSGNETDGFGGAVSSGSGKLLIEDSVFVGNRSASAGGAIRNVGGTLTVVNSTFSDNVGGASGVDSFGIPPSGGVIYHAGVAGMAAVFRHATLADNQGSADGEEILDRTIGMGLPLVLQNSIIRGAGAHAACAGPLVSEGGNVGSDATCGLDEPDDLPSAEAMLGPLAFGGGTTRTRALLAGSDAIDAGRAANCEAVDQRGLARDAACDAGAFEFGAPGACASALAAALEADAGTAGEAVACLRGDAGL